MSCMLCQYQLKEKNSPLSYRCWTVHSMANFERLLNPFRELPMNMPLRISNPGITSSENSTSGVKGLLSTARDPYFYPPPPPPWGGAAVSRTGTWARVCTFDVNYTPYPVASYSSPLYYVTSNATSPVHLHYLSSSSSSSSSSS